MQFGVEQCISTGLEINSVYNSRFELRVKNTIWTRHRFATAFHPSCVGSGSAQVRLWRRNSPWMDLLVLWTLECGTSKVWLGPWFLRCHSVAHAILVLDLASLYWGDAGWLRQGIEHIDRGAYAMSGVRILPQSLQVFFVPVPRLHCRGWWKFDSLKRDLFQLPILCPCFACCKTGRHRKSTVL